VYRSRPISLALIGLFVWLTACTSYKQIELSEVADYGKVRVTLTGGERETFADPRVEADSIKGKDAAAIPLDQVAEVEAKKKDLASTLVLVGVGVALVTVITLRIAECATNSYGSEC
jgi:hypothetical protein